eukprot:2384578-Pyramimonas_sp.AAC.1
MQQSERQQHLASLRDHDDDGGSDDALMEPKGGSHQPPPALRGMICAQRQSWRHAKGPNCPWGFGDG